ncbi:MAG: hypothetical protein GY878_04400 [Fuerstiella sp.]|nr:hypothetical protein [Fuerstiella sp.]
MSRPATLKVGNTAYWTIMTYTSAGVLVDADSTPAVIIYKNGSLTADVVTVTKRSATTGIYDAYYNPASELEGDCFTIQETATISSQAYVQAWNFEVLAAERGTDGASTFDAASDAVANVTTVSTVANAVTTDAASRTASQADVSALATAASIAGLNNFNPASDAVANVTTVGTVTNAVTTDSASRTAAQADVSGLATAASIAALNDFNPVSDAVVNVTTVGTVTNAVTTDSASRTASQADVSALATAASVSALNDLDAAGVRSAVGLASANLDAQLGTVDTVVGAVKVKTDQLTFTSANSVDATAAVSVDTSSIANAVIAGIGGTAVTISSVVATDGTTITIVQGDDYNSSESRQITWAGATADQWPSLSGATLSLTASNRLDSLTVVPTITSPTGTQAFQLELTKDQTNIGSGRYQYDVQATLASGRVVTLLSGEMIVKKSYTD